MIVPLRTRDAKTFAAAQTPGWLPLLPGVVLLLAFGALLGLHVRFDELPGCTATDPCGPDLTVVLAMGLSLAVPLAAFASPRVAAWLATGFLAAEVLGPHQPLGSWLSDAAFVALTWALAWRLGRNFRRPGRPVPDSSLTGSPAPGSSLTGSPLLDGSVASSAVPDASLPSSSLPDASLPSSSLPDASLPSSSLPDASLPSSSLPDASLPGSSLPDASLPDASLPSSSLPGSATGVSGAAYPSAAQPSPSHPSAAHSSPTPPSPAHPSAAQPSADHPSAAQPSAAQPSPTHPSAAQPSAAHPSAAQPSPAQPSAAPPSPAQPSAAPPSPAQPSAAPPSPAHFSPAQPSPAQPSAAQPSAAGGSPGGSGADVFGADVRAAVWAVRRRTPPVPMWRRRYGILWRVAAVVLVPVAAGIIAAVTVVQLEGEAQQRAAHRVEGEVTGHPDEYTIEVRAGDAAPVRIEVVDVAAHPVGAHEALLVDDRGLHQLVSEPYDATGWGLLGIAAAGLALACWWRGRETETKVRGLLTEPQPACRVFVRSTPRRHVIYAWDARAGDPPILELPLATRPDAPAPAPAFRAAVLYGVPAPGQWGAVEVGGEVVPPAAPLGVPLALGSQPFEGPETDVPGRTAVPVGDPADDVDPEVLHTHHAGWFVAARFIAAVPLVLWSVARWLPALSYPVAVLVTAPLTSLACYGAWRLYLRPRLAWNGAGLSVVGVTGAELFTWNMVRDVQVERDGSVVIQSPRREYVVPARRWRSLLPSHHRTGAQLGATLVAAKRRWQAREQTGQYDTTSLPAAPHPPETPQALWPIWAVQTLTYAWLLMLVTTP